MDESSEANTSTAQLAEYTELRAEIRHYLGRKQQNVNFIIVIALAAVGAGHKFNNPLLVLAATVAIGLIWLDDIWRVAGILRVATYIQVCIEREVPGLQWETLYNQHNVQKETLHRPLANAIFPGMFFFTLCAAYVIPSETPAILLIPSKPLTIPLLAPGIFCFAVLIGFGIWVYGFIVSRKRREVEIARWEKLKRLQQRQGESQTE